MKYDKPLVEIIWNDAETTHGWEMDDEVDVEQVPIVTVGFLITKGDHIVVIASSIDKATGSQSNSRIKIPVAMVSSIKELTATYKKPKKASLELSMLESLELEEQQGQESQTKGSGEAQKTP